MEFDPNFYSQILNFGMNKALKRIFRVDSELADVGLKIYVPVVHALPYP